MFEIEHLYFLLYCSYLLHGFGTPPDADGSFSNTNHGAAIIESMNIYISHCGTYDYENELYTPLKESMLASLHHFFLPHEPENIDTDAVSELKHTDMLVAEASFPSTGQGIELAQAKAAGVPIVCFYKTGTKPSGSLRFVTNNIKEYSDIHDLLAKLQTELNQHI